MRAAGFVAVLLLLCLPLNAAAGFTETLPKSTWMLDVFYFISVVEDKWNKDGELVPLIEEMVRHEPGAGKQGILKPAAHAELQILGFLVQYGITDTWSLGFGLPIMVVAEVDPRFGWEEGDYQWNLGRSYTESDFWEWAGSMGQPKPGAWRGNEWTPGDIQVGTRWRFTDGFTSFRRAGWAMALTGLVVIPTGTQPEPEDVVTSGTTSWDLHSNGDLGLHFGVDKFFPDKLDSRLVLGVDLFHEVFLPKTYESPTGEKNPLMLTYAPYTGKHYTIDGGDWTGASFQVDVVPIRGPALGTWLVKGDATKAEALPPLVTLSFRYTFIQLQQSDWDSESDVWDYEREEEWKPGYKNMLWGQATLSLLRLGVPLMPYVNYRNLTWLPSKCARAPNVYGMGTRVLLKFW
ncbi:MAG: hypothetical protein P9L99_08475 [Candidatus Lernaella stagnicola]|nr:hypothetical protein [Candidatus Lernaella stagnicola]